MVNAGLVSYETRCLHLKGRRSMAKVMTPPDALVKLAEQINGGHRKFMRLLGTPLKLAQDTGFLFSKPRT